MKHNSYLATISAKGQITVPAGLRRRLELASGSKVEISVADFGFAVRKLRSLDEVANSVAPQRRSEEWPVVIRAATVAHRHRQANKVTRVR